MFVTRSACHDFKAPVLKHTGDRHGPPWIRPRRRLCAHHGQAGARPYQTGPDDHHGKRSSGAGRTGLGQQVSTYRMRVMA